MTQLGKHTSSGYKAINCKLRGSMACGALPERIRTFLIICVTHSIRGGVKAHSLCWPSRLRFTILCGFSTATARNV